MKVIACSLLGASTVVENDPSPRVLHSIPHESDDASHNVLAINIPLDNGSDATVLDMHVVDHAESRKLKDDSKSHHILDDAMFKPRKRFNNKHRHMIEEPEQPFQHHVRQNLRHVISRQKGEHHRHSHHHHHHHHNNNHHHHHRRQSHKKPEENKEVSFASLLNSEPEVLVSRPSNASLSRLAAEEEGITFTVSYDKQDTAGPDFIVNMEEFNPQTSKTRTVAETTLPWKTFSSNPKITPVAYQTMVPLNDIEEPCLCDTPAWLADSDTDQLTVVPISLIGTHLKSCLRSHTQHDINEKVTVINFRRQNGTKMPTTASAPHLLQSKPKNTSSNGKTKPDILNCSSPNKELQRKKKIDDFQEKAPKYLVESIDLRQNTQVIKKGSPEDKLDCAESVNGWSSQSHTSGTDECYLPATWTTRENGIDNIEDVDSDEMKNPLTNGQPNSHVEHDQDEVMAEVEPVEVEANLPPPWKNQSESSDEGAQRSAVLFEIGDPSESTSVRSLPWESHLHDEELMPRPSLPIRHLRLNIEEEANMDEIDQSSMKCLSDHDADDCLPPPWRSVNPSERSVPIRSPSASHELDSLFPQASHCSLRMSEAESRHSEQFRGHHHVIDIAPRELEHTASCPALAAMVGSDPEPVDLLSRVEMWLLSTKLDQQDPIPDDLYYTESQCSDYDADTDLADCEDNSL